MQTLIKVLNNILGWKHPLYVRDHISDYLLLAVCFLVCSFSSPAKAQNLNMIPSLEVTGGYNDNILFNNTEAVADYYTSLKPMLNIEMATERYDLNIVGYTELYRYRDENDLDYETYRLGANGRHQMTERLSLSGEVTFISDTTLESELEETGRIVSREDRERGHGETGLSFDLSEVSQIGLEYRYQSTEYESDDRIDRVAHRFQIPYRQWFNDRLDQLTLQPSYTRTETEDNREIDYYKLSVGWTHVFSKTLRMRNFIGYQYTVTTSDDDQDSSRSGSADLSIIQTGELFSFRLGLRSNIYVDVDGSVDEVDRIYCRVKRNLTEKLSAQFYGSVYINRPLEEYSSADSVFYDLEPELSYQITESHSLNTFYRYSYEVDQTVSEDQVSVRNVVEVYVLFQF